MRADWIIMEEMAAMNPQVFFAVIVPLLQVVHTCMLAISTMKNDADNLMTTLMNIRGRDGELLFKSVRFEIKCRFKECQDNPENCIHRTTVAPAWVSAARVEMGRRIMATMPDLFQQEFLAVTTDAPCAFSVEHIDALQNRGGFALYDPVTRTRRALPETVYVGVDPSAGGEGSNYAIVSFYVYNDVLVVSYRCCRAAASSAARPSAPAVGVVGFGGCAASVSRLWWWCVRVRVDAISSCSLVIAGDSVDSVKPGFMSAISTTVTNMRGDRAPTMRW